MADDGGRIDEERLAASLEGVRQAVVAEESLAVLPQILDACRRLFGLAGCGVLLDDPDIGLRAGAATGPISRALEETQARIGEGPCVDAFVTGGVVDTEDLRADDRWPVLRTELHHVPVRGVLGMPVEVDGISVGSIDVFRDDPCEWDGSQRDALAAYSAVVSSLLETVVRLAGANETASQLHRALETRVEIERAVGYLMAREHLDASSAFAKLRSAARAQRRKVRELATEVLSGDASIG